MAFVAAFSLDTSTWLEDLYDRFSRALPYHLPFELASTQTPMGFAFGGPTDWTTRSDWSANSTDTAGLIVDGPIASRISAPGEWFAKASSVDRANIIHWDAQRKQITILADRLGFRCLYYWVSRSGRSILLASHLRLLRVGLPNLEPSVDAFVAQMLLSASCHDETLLSGAKRLMPGARVTLDENGFQIREFDTDPLWTSAGVAEDNEEHRLVEFGKSVLTELTSCGPVTVSLSGGYDSRFLTLLLLEANVAPACITLGKPDWSDTSAAIRFCQAYGLRLTNVVPSETQSFLDYVAGVLLTEHTSDYMSATWIADYGRSLTQMRSVVVNGFLGEAVTGAILKANYLHAHAPQEIVDTWYAHVTSRNIPSSVLIQLCQRDVAEIEKRIRKYLFARALPYSDDNRRCVYALDFGVRYFGFVSLGTYNLFRNFCQVRAPFADFALFDFFTRLKTKDLLDQNLYKRVVSRLDRSGTEIVGTSPALRDPATFLAGPYVLIAQRLRQLYPDFCAYLRDNEQSLSKLFVVNKLRRLLTQANSSGSFSDVRCALIAMNAAILFATYSKPANHSSVHDRL